VVASTRGGGVGAFVGMVVIVLEEGVAGGKTGKLSDGHVPDLTVDVIRQVAKFQPIVCFDMLQ